MAGRKLRVGQLVLVLSSIALVTIVAFIAIAGTLAASADGSAVAAGTCGSARSSLDSEEQAAVVQVNAYRAEHGLGQLRISPTLTGIGTWMLGDAADSGRVEHTDSLGRSAYARAVACGYPGGAGENLAAGGGWDTAAEAVEAWKGSAGHNANLLSKYYTEVGVARYYRAGSAYGWYWAMEFGSNAAASAPAAAPTQVPSTPTQLPPTPAPTQPASTPTQLPATPTQPPPSPTSRPSATPTRTPSTASSVATAAGSPPPLPTTAPGVTGQSVSSAADDQTPVASADARPWRLFLPAY